MHVGHTDIHLNSAATWQWMADMLQFWTDLSGPRLFGSIFCYPSALVEQLMVDINPGIDIAYRITWERIVNNTYDWLNARALFDTGHIAQDCMAHFADNRMRAQFPKKERTKKMPIKYYKCCRFGGLHPFNIYCPNVRDPLVILGECRSCGTTT